MLPAEQCLRFIAAGAEIEGNVERELKGKVVQNGNEHTGGLTAVLIGVGRVIVDAQYADIAETGELVLLFLCELEGVERAVEIAAVQAALELRFGLIDLPDGRVKLLNAVAVARDLAGVADVAHALLRGKRDADGRALGRVVRLGHGRDGQEKRHEDETTAPKKMFDALM